MYNLSIAVLCSCTVNSITIIPKKLIKDINKYFVTHEKISKANGWDSFQKLIRLY